MVSRTREEWRELGFWYDYDQQARRWILRGTARGLDGLADAIERHATHPQAKNIGEHTHYGPYMYFTVTTWPELMIAERGLFGLPAQLLEISRSIRALVRPAAPVRIPLFTKLRSEDGSTAVFYLEPDGYNPASSDITIKDEPL